MGYISWHVSVSPSLKQRLLIICTRGNRGRHHCFQWPFLAFSIGFFYATMFSFFFMLFVTFYILFTLCPSPLFHFPFTVPHPQKETPLKSPEKGFRTNLKPYDYLDKNKHTKEKKKKNMLTDDRSTFVGRRSTSTRVSTNNSTMYALPGWTNLPRFVSKNTLYP